MPSSFIQKHQNHPSWNQIKNSHSLDELNKLMLEDKILNIAKNAKNCVFSDGNRTSQIMLIGEAPGENEDLKGIPFCGRSGKYLDQFLQEVGLSRDQNVYITNVVNWRPENNRKPSPEEIIHCLPYLEKHIQILNPKIIATLGSTATFAILDRSSKYIHMKIGPLISKTYSYKNYFSKIDIPIIPLYHPSYMLRKRDQKSMDEFRNHFKILKTKFNKLSLEAN
jgi:uracil-DNA glycosylase family 4